MTKWPQTWEQTFKNASPETIIGVRECINKFGENLVIKPYYRICGLQGSEFLGAAAANIDYFAILLRIGWNSLAAPATLANTHHFVFWDIYGIEVFHSQNSNIWLNAANKIQQNDQEFHNFEFSYVSSGFANLCWIQFVGLKMVVFT